jgi:hypothetical protein
MGEGGARIVAGGRSRVGSHQRAVQPRDRVEQAVFGVDGDLSHLVKRQRRVDLQLGLGVEAMTDPPEPQCPTCRTPAVARRVVSAVSTSVGSTASINRRYTSRAASFNTRAIAIVMASPTTGADAAAGSDPIARHELVAGEAINAARATIGRFATGWGCISRSRAS